MNHWYQLLISTIGINYWYINHWYPPLSTILTLCKLTSHIHFDAWDILLVHPQSRSTACPDMYLLSAIQTQVIHPLRWAIHHDDLLQSLGMQIQVGLRSGAPTNISGFSNKNHDLGDD